MLTVDAWLTPGKTHGRPGNRITPAGICVHYAGNPGSSAQGNRNYFENGAGGYLASAHYVIGLDGEVLRLIPENERANHAGKYYGVPGTPLMASRNNSLYIGIECCHAGADGEFNGATRAALVELCADICKRRGFDPRKDIVRHYDITGKECPRYYVRNPAEWVKLAGDITIAAAAGRGVPETVDVFFPGGATTVPAEFEGDTWLITLADETKVKVRDVLAALGYSVQWEAASNTIIATVKHEEGA